MEWETRSIGQRRARLEKSFSIHEIVDPPAYSGSDYFQNKYVLEMRISTSFWSNDAQKDRKIEDAKKTAQAYLFKDMLPIVREIMVDSDDDNVRRNAAMLIDMMTGKN